MAHTVKELKFGSREGSSRGAGGVNDKRTFLVTLDITDDQFTEQRYPDPRGVVELQWIRYGSASPWNAYAKATQYTIDERISNKTWRVSVNYTVGGLQAVPTMEAAWDRWNVSIRGAAYTQQIREEPTEAIESWGINQGPEARDGKLIGTQRYAKLKPGVGQAAYTAQLWRTGADGRLEFYSQQLARTTSRIVRPYSADVPALTYTQTRLFANFNFNTVGYIAEYYKRVNLYTYLGAPPGHLKFVDFSLDEVPHAIGSPDDTPQLEYGIAYRTALVFLWSAKAFTPLEWVSTVHDELGNEVPVRDYAGNKVVDVNWTIAGVNFGTLIRVLAMGAQRPPPPRLP